MNGFQVKRKDMKNVSIIYLKGYLDAHTAPDFEKSLQELIDENQVRIMFTLC